MGTAEPWHVWLENPELVEHVDYIAVHLLPYWEGMSVDKAVDYLAMRVEQLQRAYPGKQVVIAEIGWPSRGRTREAAVASTSNEAMFLRRFLSVRAQEGSSTTSWKRSISRGRRATEGAVGAYWGVYDVDRQPKFAFIDPIVRIPRVAHARRDFGGGRVCCWSLCSIVHSAHARIARPQLARDRRVRRTATQRCGSSTTTRSST